MEIAGQTVLILGGSGLVGCAVARRLMPFAPEHLVIAALTEVEARDGVSALAPEADVAGVELTAEWGDVFVRVAHKDRSRSELLGDRESRAEVLDDLFGPLDDDASGRSTLVGLLENHRPDIVIDCINTATVIAYQDLFRSATTLRAEAVAAESEGEGASLLDAAERHLATLYLPQLIRHVQLMLEGLHRANTVSYVKIGTSGTGGMGLNVPFTHSEERPSRTLLAKASLAGAHSMLLFLLARTPDSPAVAEIKPTAAIAWKRIAYGAVTRAGRAVTRSDSTGPIDPGTAFVEPGGWEELDEPIESVFLDAGENGMFALSEFETISALGLMEIVTPEEVADAVVREIRGRPTGKNVVDALDASAFGPTYRGGVMRNAALSRMEELEAEHGVRSIAFEMLGPPRLNKLLFEAHILERLYETLDRAARLDPAETAGQARQLVEDDDRLRSDILSIGIPILLPDGTLLRGRTVKIGPEDPNRVDVDRLAHLGWVDLRAASWDRWRVRAGAAARVRAESPGVDAGSGADWDVRSGSPRVRPGALAARVLLEEEGGVRLKR